MEDKNVTLKSLTGDTHTTELKTLSFFGGMDLKTMGFFILRPMILKWLREIVDSGDAKNKLKIDKEFADKLYDYLSSRVDGILAKL